jgi:hypothetical protein
MKINGWLVAGLLIYGCGSGGIKPSTDQGPVDVSDAAEDTAESDTFADATADAVTDRFESDIPILPGEFGAPCNQNLDCDSGFCVEGPEGYFCTRSCVQDCPEGFLCRSFTALGDIIFLCMPDFVKVCSPCSRDAQCPGGRCINYDGSRQCAGPCDEGGTCKDERLSCQQIELAEGENEEFCLPRSGSCSCLDEEQEGDVRTCSVTNDDGTCYGVETCDPEAGWEGCTATQPLPEDCNGLDDNCNGQVDEGLPVSQECDVQNIHGTCSGLARCMGPLGWICDAAEAAPEVCNGRDDNCDGQTDEGFQVDGVYGSVAHCGACNSSCVGLIPNATEACDATGAGGPRCVVASCNPGFFQVSDTQCFSLGTVLCLVCETNADCATGHCVTDGGQGFCSVPCTGNAAPQGYQCKALDQGGTWLVPASGACGCDQDRAGQTRPCRRTRESGTCFGFETCDPAVGWVGCTAREPAPETCNGLDDDCNGIVDDGLALGQTCQNTVPGVGTCEGVLVCQGTLGEVCTAREPVAEMCNYQDSDCNGVIDDGFLVDGIYGTDQNCGVCGNDCARAIANGVGKCSVGPDGARCVVDTCLSGYFPVGGAACLAVPDVVCSPCVADAQCLGGRCLVIGDGSYCTRDCDGENPCPDGSSCQEQGGFDVCIPDTGSCACTAGSEGDARLCRVSNDSGTCFGAETCLPASGGWVGCDAPVPAEEICNGIDDNCNGLADEGLELTRPCEVTVPGVGTCTGLEVCTRSGYVCNAATPESEVCDFRDNDCDGNVDEDFKSPHPVTGEFQYVHPDHCGTCGVRCADRILNGTTRCELRDGFPTCVVDECHPGFYRLNDFQCILAPDVTCRPCDTDDQCFGGVCSVIDGKAFCLARCTPGGADCAAGFSCQEDLADNFACIPTVGSCDCSVLNAGTRRVCSQSNGYGTCFGFQTCDPSFGWSACDAAIPGQEICDGIDNDCNGLVDDGLADSQPCQVTNAFGTCQGQAFCYGRVGWVCQAESPKAEVCDYIDNNCDGQVDEGFQVDGRYVAYNHCGSCGASCGQGFPNATTICDASELFPMCKVESCDPGYFKLNDFQCIPNISKLCEPCLIDANCIAEGARCVPIGEEGSFCGLSCAVQADCDAQILGYECVDFGGFRQCIPASGSCTCDSRQVGLQTVCTASWEPAEGLPYTCYGVRTCTVEGWSDCAMPVEECNLIDDNCDGLVDEGFVDGNGDYLTDRHCGKCGNNCTLLDFGNATGVCNTLVSPVRCGPQCDTGYFDLDSDPRDCECHYLSEVDHPGADFPQFPDSLDVNCDGIDGEVDNAIFVAKNGNDAWPGSLEEPKRTIQAGIDAAALMDKRDVYVATGVYSEIIALAASVAVYGGYSADFRVRNVLLYESAILSPAPLPGLPGAVNAIGIQGGLPGTTVFDGFTVFGFNQRSPGMSSYSVYLRECDITVRISNNRVFGGSGGPGLRGTDGVDGSGGTPGALGIDAFDLLARYGIPHCSTKTQYTSPGGLRGSFACGGIDVSGGAGGLRTCPALISGSNSITELPVATEFGSPGVNNSAGGGGGSPGRDVYHQAYSCDGYSTLGPVEGGNGVDGDEGTNGLSGTGCPVSSGSVAGGIWQPALAQDGTTGFPGGGGAGGGSGAGAWTEQSCFAKGFNYDNFGGTGGGGGSGGCQGTAGSAGTGAGGAFTIFVVFEQVPVTLPMLYANTLAGGVGGPGGAGGNGGVGGSGGFGAQGGAGGGGYIPPTTTYPAFKGGKGGSGGRGGHGGGGGGGCGGPAYGIYVTGIDGGMLDDWKAENVFDGQADGGPGGLGGFSLGQPGGDGLDGEAGFANF